MLAILFSTNVGITPPSGSNRSFRLVMYGLGLWVGNWTFKAQVYPICTNTQHLTFTLLILQFSTKNNFQTSPNLCLVHQVAYTPLWNFFLPMQTLNSIYDTRSSYLFIFIQGFGNCVIFFLLKLSITLRELWVSNSHTSWY